MSRWIFVKSVPLWSPADLTDLRAWYKADAITGLSDGDPVSTWSDSSGGGYDLTQTSTARPLYQTNTLNGLPVVEFDGSDDSLAAATASDWTFMHNTGCTVAAVWQAGTSSNPGGGSAYQDGLLSTQGSLSGTNRGVSITYRNNTSAGVTDSVANFISSGANWVAVAISGSNEQEGGAAAVLCCVMDPSNATLASRSSIRVNGNAAIENNTNDAPKSISSPNAAMTLGYPSNSLLHGYIAEVVICDAVLGSTDREKLEGYLAWKWGLESNLPNGHPYENAAPLA